MAQHFDIGSTDNPVFAGTAIALQFTMTPQTNVSAWTVLLSFKKTAFDNAFIKQYGIGTGVTVTDAVNGIWTVLMSHTDTLLFSSPGTYVYSFERVDSGGEAVLMYGAFQVARKVNS